MAHMLSTIGGKANFAYIGEKPWWEGMQEKYEDKTIILSGTKMEPSASIEDWRRGANLDFNVVKLPQTFLFNGEQVESEKRVLVRDDVGIELGTCTDRYQIVQPTDVTEFFRSVIEDHGFTLETMGALDNGRRIWAMAKVGNNFFLPGLDKVEQYCLLSTSFDGSIATQGLFTTVRVVCNNTLSLAVNKGHNAAVRVTHATKFCESKLKVDMGLQTSVFAQFEEDARKLSQVKVADDDAKKIITTLFAEEKKPEEIKTRQMNIITNVYDLYKGKGMGSKLEAANGSLWGVLNAVTEYVDHHQGRNLNNRLKAAWWGVGSNFKQDAFQHVMKLAA